MNIEKITWFDSYGAQGGWQKTEELKIDELLVMSVGIVIKENKDWLQLAMSFSWETSNTPEQVNGVMTIPKICIKQRESLIPS